MDVEEMKYLDPTGLARLWEKIKEQNLVFSATTEEWNAQPKLKARAGAIYIQTDKQTDKQGDFIPSFKVGDGTSYLIDMPFGDKLFWEHINDDTIHVTPEEKEFWNNKVRCYIDGEVSDGTLIFTTN